MDVRKARDFIKEGKTVLGIELGSTRIKGVLLDQDYEILASGGHAWENRLEDGVWTYHLDEVWYMPNGNPPHKSNAAIEAKSRNRVEMVKRAIEGTPYFVLQPYEIENPAIHYSYKTMEHFKEVYPEHEFYFIIWADSLFCREKWKFTEKLLKT